MISIMIATRERVNWLIETIESCLNTATDPNSIEFVIYYDSDDYNTDNFIKNTNYNIVSIKADRVINKSLFFNRMCDVATNDIVGGFSDDFRFRTNGWDKVILDLYNTNSPLSVIWGNDGIQQDRIMTHFFVKKIFKETLGYIWNENMKVAYCDNWMTETAKMANLALYRDDLFFEHIHPDVGKSERDNVYNESHCLTSYDTNFYLNNTQLLFLDSEKLRIANESY